MTKEGQQTPEASQLRGSNQGGMRAYNERAVLTLLRQSGPLAKSEIARATGLTAQTVSVIMRALEAEGLLQRCDPVRGRIGQPMVPMRLAERGAFFLGLKVGRRSLEIILTDFLGRVLAARRQDCRFPSPDEVLAFASDAAASLTGALEPAEQSRLAGLGVAMPFYFWDWTGAPEQPGSTLSWQGRDIAAELSARLQIPVYAENDGSAACNAELVFGGPEVPRDFLYVFIGYFAGGGLAVEGQLFTGRSGNAGAVGSLPVGERNGRPVQLIEVASLAALERMLADSGRPGAALWASPDAWDVPPALLDTWVGQAAQGLSRAIAAASCMIDFQTVVIDGWLPAGLRHGLTERTRTHLNNNRLPGVALPELREGTAGSGARSLGAASLPLSRRFLVDRTAFLKGATP